MQSQMADQHTHGSASRFQSIDIEHCLLETVPSNVGSPGLLRTPEGEGRKLELEGKKFEERIWLLECRLQCKGQPTGKTIQHEGLSFRRIVDGTDEKFVQNLELSSLVQSEGRQFLKWVTLTVPPPPQTNTYHGIQDLALVLILLGTFSMMLHKALLISVLLVQASNAAFVHEGPMVSFL